MTRANVCRCYIRSDRTQCLQYYLLNAGKNMVPTRSHWHFNENRCPPLSEIIIHRLNGRHRYLHKICLLAKSPSSGILRLSPPWAELHIEELRVLVFGLGEGPAQICNRMPDGVHDPMEWHFSAHAFLACWARGRWEVTAVQGSWSQLSKENPFLGQLCWMSFEG